MPEPIVLIAVKNDLIGNSELTTLQKGLGHVLPIFIRLSDQNIEIRTRVFKFAGFCWFKDSRLANFDLLSQEIKKAEFLRCQTR